jgi:predicted nucleic acid-binding protein
VQVLNEYFVNVTRKLDPGLPSEEAWDDVEALSAWNPLPSDMSILTRAFAVQRRYRFSWWDSMIGAVAEAAGCTRILSENLSHDTIYCGFTVENLFVEMPGKWGQGAKLDRNPRFPTLRPCQGVSVLNSPVPITT